MLAISRDRFRLKTYKNAFFFARALSRTRLCGFYIALADLNRFEGAALQQNGVWKKKRKEATGNEKDLLYSNW